MSRMTKKEMLELAHKCTESAREKSKRFRSYGDNINAQFHLGQTIAYHNMAMMIAGMPDGAIFAAEKWPESN